MGVEMWLWMGDGVGGDGVGGMGLEGGVLGRHGCASLIPLSFQTLLGYVVINRDIHVCRCVYFQCHSPYLYQTGQFDS